jgi:hypothetical protein
MTYTVDVNFGVGFISFSTARLLVFCPIYIAFFGGSCCAPSIIKGCG